MKIKGVEGGTGPLHGGGVVVFGYRRDGSVVVQKHPRRRRGRLPPVTQQQTTAWDAVQNAIKLVCLTERLKAITFARGHAYVWKDVLTLAAYGHLVSWSGWGPYPFGDVEGEIRGRKYVNGRVAKRVYGNPQRVNVPKRCFSYGDKDHQHHELETPLLADPMLALFCCKEEGRPSYTMRKGQLVIHGKRSYMPCTPVLLPPTTSNGYNHTWDVPFSAPNASCPDCHYMFVQQDTAPYLHWQSQVHPCPKPVDNYVDFWAEYHKPAGPPGQYPVTERIRIDQHGDIDNFAGPIGQPRTIRCPRTGFVSFKFTLRVGGSDALPAKGHSLVTDFDTGDVLAQGPTVTGGSSHPVLTTAVVARRAIPAGPGLFKMAMWFVSEDDRQADDFNNRFAPSQALHWSS